MNGQGPQVELSKEQPNFSSYWRGVLGTFGILQGQESLETPTSNIKEGWDYTDDGIRNIKFEYDCGQTGTNRGKRPLKNE